MNNPLCTVLTFLCLLLTACSGGELVGIHLTLAKDGSGTVTTRSLVEPSAALAAEASATGVTWTARASVHASQGSFRSLDQLKFGGGGLHFATNLDGDLPSVRVYIPRGPAAAWVKSLAPARGIRRKLAKVYDPTGKTREVGDVIRLEIELPGNVVASSVYPTGRGIEADRERRRAFLLLPARSVADAGEELVWDITWR